jgi:hypothetical protein
MVLLLLNSLPNKSIVGTNFFTKPHRSLLSEDRKAFTELLTKMIDEISSEIVKISSKLLIEAKKQNIDDLYAQVAQITD